MRSTMRALILFGLLLAACSSHEPSSRPVVVLVSADGEWRAIDSIFATAKRASTPWGESLVAEIGPTREPVLFVHGGWGKIAAAGSAQYVIDDFHPTLLVNLGTCGGFEGLVRRGDVILVERTVVYDIIERMGDPQEAIADYATKLDLSWVGLQAPTPVVRATIVSADQDLDPATLSRLHKDYGAVAGDWESGAIAYTARRNGTRLLILRGVTDVVGPAGDETYANEAAFVQAAKTIMADLISVLPAWIARSRESPR